MLNSTILRATGLWRLGVAAIVFWTVASFSWCQTTSSSPRASASATRPFAGFDDSLSKAADTLLVSVALATETPNGKTQSASLAMPDERLRIGGQSAAAIRLNLLRPAIEPILRSHGVPADLAAVILVESGGVPQRSLPKARAGFGN